MDINKKTIVVVGGASGLGEATCRALAKNGAQVIIFDREKEKADQIAVELNGRAFQADVTDTLSLEKAFSSSGPIHAVINTAGICPAERVLGKAGIATLTHFETAIAVNLVGSFNVIRLAAKVMSEQEPLTPDGERGVLINTASIAAYEGQVGQAAYSASKAGVIGMTLPIARELTRVGIRIMTIAPGVFQTPMMDALTEKVSNALSESVPFPKRLGFPKEYAALVVHILENSYLNGGTIRLDGALRMS
jgi:3-hydroxyacyl-CoA dehydrogenase / 3-hydroxy-2-methylbutyryl-CoA dehydrogenase